MGGGGWQELSNIRGGFSNLGILSEKGQWFSEWGLSPRIFQLILMLMNHPNINLFASKLLHQSHSMWVGDQTRQWETDDFQIDWYNLQAFPPFTLIGRALAKVRKEKAVLTIVTPVWQSQAWYPQLLSMSIQNPLQILPEQNLLLDQLENQHLLIQNKDSNHGGLEDFRKRPAGEGVSKATAALITDCRK